MGFKIPYYTGFNLPWGSKYHMTPVHVTDFPIVNVPVDELSSARIWQDKLCASLSANVNINYRLPIKVQLTLVISNSMGLWKKFESTVLRLKRSYENTGSVVCLTMKGWVLHWFDQHLCVRLFWLYTSNLCHNTKPIQILSIINLTDCEINIA
jgi:hypothetical protein